MSEENIYTSLLKIQEEIDHRIIKSSDVSFPGTNYSFVPIEEVIDKIKPLATKYGILILQFNSPTESAEDSCCMIHVTTTLMHVESESLVQGTLSIGMPKLGGQEAGKAITYARRYALCTMFGLTPVGEDDDCAPKGATVLAKPKKRVGQYEGPVVAQTPKKAPKKGLKKSSGLKKASADVNKAVETPFSDE